MKCDEAARLSGFTSYLQAVFDGSEHDWRIMTIAMSMKMGAQTVLEESCRRCPENKRWHSGLSIEFWSKKKKEQPEG